MEIGQQVGMGLLLLLMTCALYNDITRLVNRIIIHEIGTHFGFTQEDIEMYEEDMFGATVSGNSAG